MGERARAATTRPHRRRAQRLLYGGALTALLVGTVVGALAARREAIDTWEQRAQLSARETSSALETEIDDVISSLGGAEAVVRTDGSLDLDVFEGYASDVLSFGRVPGVGLVGIVDGDDRAAFEMMLGQEMVVIDGRGGTRRAPDAPTHYPVVAVESSSGGPSALGLDYGADDIRARAVQAALSSDMAAISDPLTLARSGQRAVLVVRPLFHRTAESREVVGFAVTNLQVDDLRTMVRDAAGDDMRAAVQDGALLLTGPEFDPRERVWTATVSVADQEWLVSVAPADRADLTLAWLVAGGGSAAALALVVLWFVTARYQRSLALRNRQLAQNEERGHALQAITGQLARALTGEDVVRALVDHLPLAVGAHRAVLALETTNGTHEVYDHEGSGPRTIDASGSLVEGVVTGGEPAWISSPLAWRNDPATTDLAAGGTSLAVVPILAGQVRGALVVSWSQVHIVSEQEQSLLRTVGLLTGRALARGRRYETARDAAVAFQRAALPHHLPEVEGLDIAARYRPAVRQATVGGDWYDVLELDDGRIALLVGDVVGHGIEAAATMGRLRTAFQVIASLHTDPGEMLQLMGQHVDLIPNAFCTTIVCAVLDPRTGTLDWSRSGHLPPLVIVGDEATHLDGEGAPPLGFCAEAAPPVHRYQMSSGEMIVLFTDGIVERRGEHLDVGLRRLASVAGSLADLAPEDFSDALVEAMAPSDIQMDDLAVLVARIDRVPTRVNGSDAMPAPTLDEQLDATPEAAGQGRDSLRRWLETAEDLDDDTTEDLVVVVSELISNAAAATRSGRIGFRARLIGHQIEIEVQNGPGSVSDDVNGPWDLEDPLRGGGRGLMIVRAFVDSIEFEPRTEDAGMIVRCRRALTSEEHTATT